MKLIILIGFFAFANCKQVDKVRNLLNSFDHSNAATDALIEETKGLIIQTKEELENIQALAQITVLSTMNTINQSVSMVLAYGTTRTVELVNYLVAEVETLVTSKPYPTQASSDCLTVLPFLKALPTNFLLRLKVSLETSERNVNATIRQDFEKMDDKLNAMNSLTNALNYCEEDNICVLEVAKQTVKYNTEFIVSFNEIYRNLTGLPAIAANAAISAANITVYHDEEYACDNANMMIDCINSFDDEADYATTTTWLPSKATTKVTEAYTTEELTTEKPFTEEPITEGPITDEQTTETPIPKFYCTHEPFQPDILI